jgi:hypothetical protein
MDKIPVKLVGTIFANETYALFDVYASKKKIYLTQDHQHKYKEFDQLRSPIQDWMIFNSPEEVRHYVEALYEHAEEDITNTFFKPYEH